MVVVFVKTRQKAIEIERKKRITHMRHDLQVNDISLLRNATKNRAVIAISFIGKSILEIVTPKNKADRLVIALEAIGYRHLSRFEPTKKGYIHSQGYVCRRKKKEKS